MEQLLYADNALSPRILLQTKQSASPNSISIGKWGKWSREARKADRDTHCVSISGSEPANKSQPLLLSM